MATIEDIKKELLASGDPVRAVHSQRFFKTGQGEYGEGDIFLCLTVPEQRKIARKYKGMPLSQLRQLLTSKVHEFRFTCLEVLVAKYEKGSEKDKEAVFNFYLRNRKCVNNWDLVDTSVQYIVGDYLRERDKSILYELAVSQNIWERRMAMIATQAYINRGEFKDAFKVAELLVRDEHDLIQKAVGWMLREIGKRSQETEEKFLAKHYKYMPRTMLRYAIERFPEKKRVAYLRGKM